MIEDDIAREGGELILNCLKETFETNAPRLAGSGGEKLCAERIAAQMDKTLGNSQTQTFKFAHNASYNSLPVLGAGVGCAFVLYYLSAIASLVLCSCITIFFFVQVCFHKGWLDCFFKKKQSQNVFSKVSPNGDKGKLTLIFAGNLDSFYKCNNPKKSEKANVVKMFVGLFSILFLGIFSIMSISHGVIFFDYIKELAVKKVLGAREIYSIILYCLPLLCAPGIFIISDYISLDEKNAPSTCVNGLVGTQLGIAVSQYFLENPKECPPDCDIITIGFGAETSGQKGSEYFCKHERELLSKNPYVVNLGGFSVDDVMNIKHFDLFSRSVFDRDLMDLAEDALIEMNIDYKYSQNILNCSPTVQFAMEKIPTLAINPQVFFTTREQQRANEIAHISPKTAGKYLIFLLSLIPKIANYNDKKLQEENICPEE